MRHNKAGKKLNRSASHRKAMFRNMAKALVTYEKIRTTEVRAKELSKIMDKLVTMALKNDVPARRRAYQVLGNHGLVKKLFDEIGPRFAGGKGGYTRVIKLGLPRAGDCAPMAVIELTRTGQESAPKEEAKKAAPKKAAPKQEAKAEESKAEEPKAEEPKAEEPKAEEPKAEEPKAEEPKAE